MREAFAGYSKQTCGVLLLALVLRLSLVLFFPNVGGDSAIYELFARNLLQSGTYSHLKQQNQAPLRPTMIRVPGYPLMLAAVYAIAGKSNNTAVRVVQAFLDTFTCLLIALLIFEICNGGKCGRRLAQRALLLAAVCPFLANYSASILTEVPTTLLWTSAILFGFRALKHRAPARNWLYCGLLTGGATLFRPESGILAGILGIVLVLKEGVRFSWKPIAVGACCMGVGLMLVLLPWTVRNAVTLRTFQPMAPKFAQDQNEMVAVGYFDWCLSWMWRYHDVADYWWTLEETKIPVDSPPGGDSDRQRQDVLDLIKRHNANDNWLDKASDDRFENIARERRHSHPLRHYIALPFLRALAMWFTPRVEILGFEGRMFPIQEAWDSDPVDFSVTLLLFLMNCAYVGLALWGAGKILRRSQSFEDVKLLGCVTLLAIITIRTAFFAYTMLPEPRYVLESYPAVIALGAFVFHRTGKP